MPDVQLHVWFGWALLAVAVLPVPFALRGVATFVRETARLDPGDLAWLVRWPIAVVTGRFPHHEGHFDPGQRLANVAIVALLAALIVTGAALVLIKVGPVFAVLATVHRLATIAFTIVIAGHVIIALGVLPGYRGVWRSMHLGGRLRLETARRLWPGWADREIGRRRREDLAAEMEASAKGPASRAGGPTPVGPSGDTVEAPVDLVEAERRGS